MYHSSGAVESLQLIQNSPCRFFLLHRHPTISISLPLSSLCKVIKISTFHHLISKQLIQPFTMSENRYNPNGPSSKIPAAQYRASSFRSSKGILMGGKTFTICYELRQCQWRFHIENMGTVATKHWGLILSLVGGFNLPTPLKNHGVNAVGMMTFPKLMENHNPFIPLIINQINIW